MTKKRSFIKEHSETTLPNKASEVRPISSNKIVNDNALISRDKDSHLAIIDTSGNFTHGQTQQINNLLKVSILFPLFKVWKLLAILTIVTANVFLIWGIEAIFNPNNTLEVWLGIFLRFSWLTAFTLLAYWELYRQSISGEIHEFRLNIKRGVFLHKEASVHLLPHTTFYMKQESFFELFFNLCTLNLAVVTTPETEIVTIPGLPVPLAEQLKAYLGSQIDRQLRIRQPAN
jgi:hypothetical protein